ncbi:hypothetical protein V1264_002005 [Littorina saxatilis]|uniref:Uncharacterized protein n=2 Tax=Littorina saxatilis TaxID=31220 RepID=A0AAN9GPT1_9CAEN
MDNHCVAHCPDHYFGSVQAVHLASPIQPNSTKPLLHTQGVCKPCHESCLSCRGAAATDCFQCASGYDRNGESGTCHKTMLWDLLDPAVMKHLAWAIILCIGAIILFSLAFAILQARQRRRLCWAVKQNYVPDWTKGAYNGVSVLDEADMSRRGVLVVRGVGGGGGGGGGLGGGRLGVGVHGRDHSYSLFKTTIPPTPTPAPLLPGNYRMNGYSKGPGYHPSSTGTNPKA